MKNTIAPIKVDEQGHLILPPELMRRYGFVPGALVRLEERDNSLCLSRTTANLARVYVEPTNLCNLDCRTCMRNVWDEPLGYMNAETFKRILHGVQECAPTPLIFFGGFGEPLAHPDILHLLAASKSVGAEVELITNGILLDEKVARRLVELKIDRVWFSIDGATPESYADVRLGAALPQVLENAARLRDLREAADIETPRLGIAFVAMERNIRDLPAVVRLGMKLRVDRFSISNVLPHTHELKEQILYTHSMLDGDRQPSSWSPVISLPRIDQTPELIAQLSDVSQTRTRLKFADQDFGLGVNTCPFISKGSVSIRWDGEVSPCLPLLHTHESYLGDSLRKSHSFSVGNINQRSLSEIWNDPEYVALRERLAAFDFSPCTFCSVCDMAEQNLEDCFGNSQPACGGCLWAQGFIQCP